MPKPISHQLVRYTASELGWEYLPTYGATDPGRAKVPVLPWREGGSSDLGVISDWHRQGYSLAIHCGRSGVVVLDADRPAEIGKLDLSQAWVISGNPERRSFIFDAPAGLDARNGAWAAGEIKAGNGIVVMPPSFHAIGGAYRWLQWGGTRVMPDAVRDLLQRRRKIVGAISSTDGTVPPVALTALTDGEMCLHVYAYLMQGLHDLQRSSGDARHVLMNRTRYGLVCRSAEGHIGVAAAVGVLEREYLADHPHGRGPEVFRRQLLSNMQSAEPRPEPWCSDRRCPLPGTALEARRLALALSATR